MHSFKDFHVWKRAVKLTKEVYELTATFPDEEKFGIISQLRRCAVSIPSNIAEGSGRKTDKDFSNFLGMSLGSQFELETQLIICREIGYMSDEDLIKTTNELNEIQKMTRTLIDKFS